MSENIGEVPHARYREALNTALRILTGRDHTKFELSRKLQARGYSTAAITQVISECERLDYIDDMRTAREFVRQLHGKGYGLRQIRRKLAAKGLSGTKFRDFLAESITEADESLSAAKILKKHAQRFEREKDAGKRKEKIYRFLHGRGFSSAVIAEIMAGMNRG